MAGHEKERGGSGRDEGAGEMKERESERARERERERDAHGRMHSHLILNLLQNHTHMQVTPSLREWNMRQKNRRYWKRIGSQITASLMWVVSTRGGQSAARFDDWNADLGFPLKWWIMRYLAISAQSKQFQSWPYTRSITMQNSPEKKRMFFFLTISWVKLVCVRPWVELHGLSWNF